MISRTEQNRTAPSTLFLAPSCFLTRFRFWICFVSEHTQPTDFLGQGKRKDEAIHDFGSGVGNDRVCDGRRHAD